jgi:hypothetical protein
VDGIDPQASEIRAAPLVAVVDALGGRPVVDHAFRVDALR